MDTTITMLIVVFLHCFSLVTSASVVSIPNPETTSGYYQGDIVLQPGQTSKGVAIRYPYGTPWDGGIVPYEFASNVTMNNTLFIVRMMREMENLTSVNGTQCIRFREKNESDTKFITIFNGSGCSAPVGSWGNYVGVRPVSLLDSPTATCMISGTIQHELNHVLGFFHEQARPDRDTYVSIQWDNIIPGTEFNFEKYNETMADTLMTPYDYGSVMHYGAYDFAVNRSVPTIIAVFNRSANLGQRIGLSPIDILEIQRFYGCVQTPTTTTTTTARTATSSTTTTTPTTTTTTTARTVTSTTTTTTPTTTTTTTTSTTNSTTTRITTTSTTTTTTTTTTITTTTTTITTTSETAMITTQTTSFITTTVTRTMGSNTTVSAASFRPICHMFTFIYPITAMLLMIGVH